MEQIYTPAQASYAFTRMSHQPLTIAMVITGDNDLDDLAWGDTKELRRGLRHLPDDIAVTLFSDRKADNYSGWSYYRGGEETAVQIPEPNTNNPYYLEEFLKWSHDKTKTAPHGFIFWGHSDGGICIGPDDNPVDQFSPGITSVELAEVFRRTRMVPLAMMLDCCLGSQLTSYKVFDDAGVKYFSGAGTSVYDSGNNYKNFFKYLSSDVTPEEMVAHFTNSYPESLLREEPQMRVSSYTNIR